MVRTSLNILVLDSSPNYVDAVLTELRQVAPLVRHAHVTSLADFANALAAESWDLLLVTVCEASSFDDVRTRLERAAVEAPVIALHSESRRDRGDIAHLLEGGATDAVWRQDLRHLRLIVEREVKNLRERQARRRAEDTLREHEVRWRSLLDSSNEPIAYLHGGMHVHANQTYLEMFGFDSLADLEGVPVLDLVADTDRDLFRIGMQALAAGTCNERSIDLKGLRVDGNTLDIKMDLSTATFDDEDCWQVVIRDRTEAPVVRAQLDYLRTHDPHTGLHNRQYMFDALRRLMKSPGDSWITLVYVELDQFQTVRESLGVVTSDELMLRAAKVLEKVAHEDDVLARLGDGVFGLLSSTVAESEAEAMGRGLWSSIDAEILDVEGRSVSMTCSLGAVCTNRRNRSAQSLFRKVQQACREAKASTGSRVKVKLQNVCAPDTETDDLSEMLAQTLDEGRLSLAFQPIVNIKGVANEVYEVLLRAKDEFDQEIATADIFTPDLDEALAARLDRWVISKSIDLIRERLNQNEALRLFVNMSGHTMLDDLMLTFIREKLREAGVPGKSLVIEVGEALVVTQVRAVQQFIKGLKKLGCEAALEHFGGGLCSVGTLRQIPVQYVKIHPDLIQKVGVSSESESALRTIVEIANSLDRKTVAFGVEDAETLSKLYTLGVHMVQGNSIQTAGKLEAWNFDTTEIT